MHTATDAKQAGLFAVEFGKLVDKSVKPSSAAAFVQKAAALVTGKTTSTGVQPLCCFDRKGVTKCVDCQQFFHLACYDLKESEVSLCLGCLNAQENADPLFAFQRHVVDEDKEATADDGDYTPAIDGITEVKEDDELKALRSTKKLQDLEPIYRRLIKFRQAKAAAALTPSPPSSVSWQPALPDKACVCYVNYPAKTCTCRGFIHTGAECSHLYAVEAEVQKQKLRAVRHRAGKHSTFCLFCAAAC